MKTALWIVFGILAFGTVFSAPVYARSRNVSNWQFLFIMTINLFCDGVVFIAAVQW